MDVYAFQSALICEPCALEQAQRFVGHSGDGPPTVTRDNLASVLEVWRMAEGHKVDMSTRVPDGPIAEGGGEADSPQHCDICGMFLENQLTVAGVEFVAERLLALAGASFDGHLGEWFRFYGDVEMGFNGSLSDLVLRDFVEIVSWAKEKGWI